MIVPRWEALPPYRRGMADAMPPSSTYQKLDVPDGTAFVAVARLRQSSTIRSTMLNSRAKVACYEIVFRPLRDLKIE